MEEDVGTSQFEEGHPVFRLLAPADLNAPTLSQPSQCSLHHPPSSGEAGFARDGTFLNLWFVASAAMLDVLLIALFLHKRVDIGTIVAFVQAHILLSVGALDHNMDHQVIHRPFVMFVRARNMDGQRRPISLNRLDFSPFGPHPRALAPSCCPPIANANRSAVPGHRSAPL